MAKTPTISKVMLKDHLKIRRERTHSLTDATWLTCGPRYQSPRPRRPHQSGDRCSIGQVIRRIRGDHITFGSNNKPACMWCDLIVDTRLPKFEEGSFKGKFVDDRDQNQASDNLRHVSASALVRGWGIAYSRATNCLQTIRNL